MKNWSGTYEFRAPRVVEATSIDDVRRAVAAGGPVRAIGTRHSFNDLADTEGTLVSTTAIPPDYVIDTQTLTVTVGAGTKYGELAAFLESEGWALHNMGSLPHISVAGAIATGTHGSGDGNGSLSTAVRALTFVGTDGELRELHDTEHDFYGSVVALGALGILVRVTLAIEPSYLMRQDVYLDLDWQTFLDDTHAVTGAGYSVSVFSDWVSPTLGQVWVKRRVTDADQTVADDLLGAHRDPDGTRKLLESVEDNTTQRAVAGAWSERLPHFRFDREPSVGDELQTEYFVGREDAADALRAVRALAADIHPLLAITELRTVAADDLWLSPAYARPSMGIHFTWRNEPEAVLALLPAIEQALAPFDARPHWGKLHTFTADRIAPLYPRIDAMRELIGRVDPEGRFWSAHLQRVLGR